MKKILIFAGTTEGRELSEILSAEKIVHTVCVATEYAADFMKNSKFAEVHCSRMDAKEMETFIRKGGYSLVVDATHPYAYEVSGNIRDALSESDIPRIRLKRDTKSSVPNSSVRYFSSNEECAKALENVQGNLLLTTGSKELGIYAAGREIRERLFVRVIPSEESLKICTDYGIPTKNIIAMQGPFSEEMNEAILDMYDISCIITKQCGRNGGFEEKVRAALKKGIPVFVINLEDSEEGFTLRETIEKMNEIAGTNLSVEPEFVVSLIGTGMGSRRLLTQEAAKAMEDADVYMGASRLLDAFAGGKENRFPVYKPKEILSLLEEMKQKSEKRVIRVAVLFSGDSSFFSGATGLYEELVRAKEEKRIRTDLRILPGISSVSYFAAKTGKAYSGAEVFSMHGRKVNHLLQKIQSSPDIFLLMSGPEDVRVLGNTLTEGGLENVTVTLGINLSYEEERIVKLTPKECTGFREEGLIICHVSNPFTQAQRASHGLKDEIFQRNSTPMTKEEIREVSICKLGLRKDSVLLDIGSGTGSIAIESAFLSEEIEVYAIERREEALEILHENINNFMLDNIKVIEGEAPEALEGISYATHAFIGGSGGRLREILSRLYRINPKMRVVINAVTVETLAELGNLHLENKTDHFEMVMIQVSRSNEAGSHHLMKAENPVWICSFDFVNEEKTE